MPGAVGDYSSGLTCMTLWTGNQGYDTFLEEAILIVHKD